MAARGARAARRPGAADRRAAYAENDSTAQSWLAAFRTALAKLGWTEGSDLRIELRWSAADADTMRTLAKELVDLRPNAIFGVTTPAIGTLASETKTIPIVFAGVSDPVGAGLSRALRIRAEDRRGVFINRKVCPTVVTQKLRSHLTLAAS